MSDLNKKQTQLAVLGAGPGGYPAAFRAAALGMDVVLIDREATPGGVCLHRGCIPSKALLHAASIITQSREAAEFGIDFAPPRIDIERLREWKRGIVTKLTGGLKQLTRARGITYLQGNARFTAPDAIEVEHQDGKRTLVTFEHAVLASGSLPARPKLVPDSARVMDSTGALELSDIPESLLVMGGGYIGLELGQFYAALGSRVDVIEQMPTLLPGVAPELTGILRKTLDRQFAAIRLDTRVTAMREEGQAVRVDFEGPEGAGSQSYSKALVAVGRRPSTDGLGIEAAGIKTTSDGFIEVDAARRTHNPAILAIGDVAGQPMLAHKATHEGVAAVENIADPRQAFDPRAIPAIVFTDPEIAWCGLSEAEARQKGYEVSVGAFPWAASGRAATLGRSEGVTRIVAEADSGRILGVGMAGQGAGELIGEAALALEMGAVAEDIARTIHAHPTLAETLMEAAELLMGYGTHYMPKK